MAQFTYKDIEEFLLDDDFFQWARYGSSDNGFNLESYKLQHPGCEEKNRIGCCNGSQYESGGK